MSAGKRKTMSSYEHGLEFDAYLEGKKEERERIIKLLEGFDPRIAIGDLLPLLRKGENK
jgi:hypothetical protein